MKKQRKGFTLVELVIVIAILGILAAYAVPKYQGLVEQARSAEARAQLGTVRSALGIYYAKNHGQYPTNITTDLFADGTIPTVEVTKKTDGSVVSSSNVKKITAGANGIVEAGDVDDDTGGWVYDVTSTFDKADVRINSKGTDPVNSVAWYTY